MTTAGDKKPVLDEQSSFVENLLSTWRVPGISVAVVDGDDVSVKAYGFAELPSTSFSPQTLSYAGSTTKAHIAALFALLIESGEYKGDDGKPLSWQTTICSIIRDDFVLQDEWATNNVTLEDALSHRTGLAKHDNAYIRYVRPEGFDGPRRIISLQELVRNLRHLPMVSSPRTQFCYVNLMFATLSHVIETLTGQWLGDALRIWLWEPLGMRNTYFSLDQATASECHVARGYYWDSGKHEYKALPRMPTEEVSGSGAVITSANDLVKWLQFWLREEMPLSAAGHRAIRHPKIVVSEAYNPAPYDTPLMYAKGWRTSSYRGHRFWTHHGAMDAFGAQVTFFPGLRLGIATLGNTAITANAVSELLTFELVDNKLNIPRPERFDWVDNWHNILNQMQVVVRNGLDTIYPTRPETPIAYTLPLHKYAGLYYHPGYKYMNLTAPVPDKTMVNNKGRTEVLLHADLDDNNFRVMCDFHHVSGEKWIMYVDMIDAPTLMMHGFGAVEFRIGANGEVEEMGIEWRARAEAEGWIWYKKVDRSHIPS